MRLIKRSPDGTLQLESFPDHDIPSSYAILSHTWAHNEEVTYPEFVSGTGKSKPGYRKITFCVDQAEADGLQYSWVDTCCIDKSTSDELNTAINSMFRWYQCASKCYVYLSDVAEAQQESSDIQADRLGWAEQFRNCKWFTRGWTLQELLAPPTVEFFSRECKRLGDKVTLEREISQITKIPVDILRGQELNTISVGDRLAWAAKRTTTRKEDRVYCLLGIFGVYLALIYGEGEEHAIIRLMEELEKVEKRQRAPGMKTLLPPEWMESGTETFPSDRLTNPPQRDILPSHAYESRAIDRMEDLFLDDDIENPYMNDSDNVSLDSVSLEPRLIIAIDYGLQWTTLAFANCAEEEIDAENDIVVMTNWGHGMDNNRAIPSVISYSRPDNWSVQQFGSDLSSDAVPMINTRLQLDLGSTMIGGLEALICSLDGMKNLSYAYVKRSSGVPSFTWKSAEEILTDFMRKVYEAFMRYIDEMYPGNAKAVLREQQVDIILTSPNLTSYRYQNSMLKAIKHAGFNELSFPRFNNFMIISEHEATALYALHVLRNNGEMTYGIGDCIMLLKADEDEVHATLYRIVALGPPIRLKVIDTPAVSRYSLSHVDNQFRKWLRHLLGQNWRELDPRWRSGQCSLSGSWAGARDGERLRRIMQDFRHFRQTFGQPYADVRFRLPKPLENLTMGYTITAGGFIVTMEQMTGFFGKVIEDSVRAVAEQITACDGRHQEVQIVIANGALFQVPYVQEEVQKSIDTSYLRKTRIHWIASNTACVEGAVIVGAKRSADLKSLVSCKIKLGLACESIMQRGTNTRITWLNDRNDLVTNANHSVFTQKIELRFSAHEDRRFSARLLGYSSTDDEDEAPLEYYSSAYGLDGSGVRTICNFSIDLRQIRLDKFLKVAYTSHYACRAICAVRVFRNQKQEPQVDITYGGHLVASNHSSSSHFGIQSLNEDPQPLKEILGREDHLISNPCSPRALFDLHTMIRERYALDTEIYQLRYLRSSDRPIALEKMQRSDALLAEIREVIGRWDGLQETVTEEEWRLLRDVKNRLLADNKRIWKDNPPWNDEP